MSQRNKRRRQDSRKRAKQEAREQAESERQRREIIGTALFELLWFGSDAYWFWPQSRTAALWLGCLGVAIAIYRHVPSLDLAVRFVAAVVLIGLLVQPYLPPNETEFHGWLTPVSDPNPPIPPQCKLPKDATLVYLVSNVAWEPNNLNEVLIIACPNEDLLKVRRRKDGGLDVDAKILDERGYAVAILERGEFTVNQNNVFHTRHPDRHTLDVIDQRDQTALHIRFVNARAIYVTGIFYCTAGKTVITDTEWVIGIVHQRSSCLGNVAAGRPIMTIK